MQISHFRILSLVALTPVLFVFGCDKASPDLHGPSATSPVQITSTVDADGDADSPLKLVGERLFRENRFSQYFFAHSQGLLSELPGSGDPVVADLHTLTQVLVNPYRGQSMSCAACHFVDQAKDLPGAGSRAYTDFTRLSPIPDRGDGQSTTVRNAPNMVSMALRGGMFLHHDGEFSTPEDLVAASYLGRNMGWFGTDKDTAIHHIAQVIRMDNGSYPTETGLRGLAYRDLFKGTNVPDQYTIPAEYRMDVTTASDQDIFRGLVKLVGGYLRTLDYARDSQGHYKGSPYDAFLRKNGLPAAPDEGESAAAYSGRLAALVNALPAGFQKVTDQDGALKLHQQSFSFTEKELAGFKVFFGAGKCVQCHSAPDFTDHLFHNTGVSQDAYDRVHGAGGFMNLNVPSLAERNQHRDLYLPASPDFPNALSLFRSQPSAQDPRRADLGVWVIFANPAIPNPQLAIYSQAADATTSQHQALLRKALCRSLNIVDCAKVSDDSLLNQSIGLVKTPSVRDLGQSQPYLHDGQADQIEDVVDFYMKTSAMARANLIRNADPRLADIQLNPQDKANLVLFLKSLNEDYD